MLMFSVTCSNGLQQRWPFPWCGLTPAAVIPYTEILSSLKKIILVFYYIYIYLHIFIYGVLLNKWISFHFLVSKGWGTLLKGSCSMNLASLLMTSRSISSLHWVVFCTKHHPMGNGESTNVMILTDSTFLYSYITRCMQVFIYDQIS